MQMENAIMRKAVVVILATWMGVLSSVAAETWTATFTLADEEYDGGGPQGASVHAFSTLTQKPKGQWTLTGFDNRTAFAQVANPSAAKPQVGLVPVKSGYLTGRVQDSGNSAYYGELALTVQYTREENVPLLNDGRKTAQKICSYSGKFETEAKGRWSATSSNSGVATVSSVSGTTANVYPTITAQSVGEATVTVKNGYSTYIYHVVVSDAADHPIDILVTNDVCLVHGQILTLTDNGGERIPWNGTQCQSSNEDIAKIVQAGDYVAVKNIVHDGTAQVVASVPGTNYHFKVRALTIGVEKTVMSASETDPNNKSNATIRITSHILYGVNSVKTDRILYLGSSCLSHGLEVKTVVDSLNALKAKGDVDWYLYGSQGSEAASPSASGTLTYKGVDIASSAISSAFGLHRHFNLQAYLKQLDEKLDFGHETYAYVVLSFDNTRLAVYSTNDDPDRNRRVAEKLSWYYANNRVIWIVDPQSGNANLPFSDEHYRPNSAYTFSDDALSVEQEAWEALTAILDPATYLGKPSGSRFTEQTQDALGRVFWAATRNAQQISYENADALTAYLNEHVHETRHDVNISDRILNLNGSLSVVPAADGQKVHFYSWAGAEPPESLLSPGQTIADLPNDDQHWKIEPASSYTVDGYQVSASISNIVTEAWKKFEINIVDNGTFLAECLRHDPPLATLDSETGKYVANPNDGPATATVTATESDGTTREATATAETSVEWKIEPKSRPVALWITDHADAGGGAVHLQFEPSFDVPPPSLAAWAMNAVEHNRIWVFNAEREDGLTQVDTNDTKHAVLTGLRKIAKPVDENAGRIWITVPVSPNASTNRLAKIVILPE